MKNLFSGLESFGLGNLKKMDIYESEEKQDKLKEEQPKLSEEEPKETDYIFEKTFQCPVCDSEFKCKTIKTGKVKLISADMDLRPRYQDVDSLKYDVVACPNCGYAALSRFFNLLTTPQAKLIKTNICSSYKKREYTDEILSYEEAINRHKLALINTVVKHGKLSEKAYICLKIAWLLRGYRETLPEGKGKQAKEKELNEQELEFLANAYDGFVEAYKKELFPMCGMDELTITYLLAELARRLGKFEESAKFVSKVITSRNANERIKDKARMIKQLISEEKVD